MVCPFSYTFLPNMPVTCVIIEWPAAEKNPAARLDSLLLLMLPAARHTPHSTSCPPALAARSISSSG